MNDLQMKAALAGVFFGIWPLLMQRSGLPGNISSAAFSIGVSIFVLPSALREMQASDAITPIWLMIVGACFVGALGIMSFNGMLAKATPQTVGSLFVLMIVVQTATPALYDIVMNGGVTFRKIAGFVLTGVAAWLLIL